ncbi:MAG: aldo/keto reductase [Thermomicrobiales bacterium]|nr:aldo/keto reductase [Thermomicrobiales bacterium]MCO5220140.1 aldo/keto reductase [Thermomicrobiales bacterium]
MSNDRLKRRRFGRSSLEVPPIAVGCAPLGDMRETFLYSVPEDQAVATVLAALASPIDYIDTAAWYGDGESERRVGLALKELGGLPDGAILQTKIGRPPDSFDFSGEVVKRRFERSMELLGVDRFDTVFLHGPEATTFEDAMSPGGPVEVLRGYYEQGVFDHFGVASDISDVDLQYLKTGLFDAVISSNRYTLLNINSDELFSYAAQHGIAVLNAAPYGSGILARGAAAYPRYFYRPAPQAMIDRALAIEAICVRYDVPLPAVALQFSLRDLRITVTIAGMSRPERIQETIDYATLEIPDELWDEIEALGPPDRSDPTGT